MLMPDLLSAMQWALEADLTDLQILLMERLDSSVYLFPDLDLTTYCYNVIITTKLACMIHRSMPIDDPKVVAGVRLTRITHIQIRSHLTRCQHLA